MNRALRVWTSDDCAVVLMPCRLPPSRSTRSCSATWRRRSPAPPAITLEDDDLAALDGVSRR